MEPTGTGRGGSDTVGLSLVRAEMPPSRRIAALVVTAAIVGGMTLVFAETTRPDDIALADAAAALDAGRPWMADADEPESVDAVASRANASSR